MDRGLRVPVAAVSGQNEGLPALSARASETNVPFTGNVVGGSVTVVPLAGGTFEISAENDAADFATLTFVVTDSVPPLDADKATLVANKGWRRRVPSKGQVSETRAAAAGDSLLILASAALGIRVHDHTGAA